MLPHSDTTNQKCHQDKSFFMRALQVDAYQCVLCLHISWGNAWWMKSEGFQYWSNSNCTTLLRIRLYNVEYCKKVWYGSLSLLSTCSTQRLLGLSYVYSSTCSNLACPFLDLPIHY